MLSRRAQGIGHSPTLRISALANRLRSEGVDVLDFSAGQPDFPTTDAAKHAGIEAIEQDRTRYTANEGLIELRREIADKLRRDNGLDYEAEQVIVSSGAKASLYFAVQALVDDGDEVLIPSPYWVSYPEQARLAGGEPVFVPTDDASGFRLDPDALRAAITPRSKLLFLNYPSNPTGCCYTRDELAALAAVCVEHGLWVLSDEIYEKLVYDDLTFTSIASLGPDIAARTIVINGMSKAYSMTGWRIGYAAGPREITSAMAKLQSHSTSNATSIAQWASLGALRGDPAELEARRLEFEGRRNEICDGLNGLDGFRCARPEGSFYVFPDVAGVFGRRDGDTAIDSGQALAQFLLERARVAVVPGEAFGAAANVRISYAVSRERIREGIERIREALSGLT